MTTDTLDIERGIEALSNRINSSFNEWMNATEITDHSLYAAYIAGYLIGASTGLQTTRQLERERNQLRLALDAAEAAIMYSIKNNIALGVTNRYVTDWREIQKKFK